VNAAHPLRHFGAAVESLRADRLTQTCETQADAAFLHMSRLRDELVLANEGPAAEHVESAIASLQDACRVLLKPAFRDDPRGLDLGLVEVRS
jgi:hypothetical protein